MTPSPDKPQRDLEHEHQPRALKMPGRGRFDDVARISEADERDLTARVRCVEDQRRAEADTERARLAIEQRTRVGRLVDDALDAVDEIKRALGYVDRDTYRDLDRARRSLGRLKSQYADADYN